VQLTVLVNIYIYYFSIYIYVYGKIVNIYICIAYSSIIHYALFTEIELCIRKQPLATQGKCVATAMVTVDRMYVGCESCIFVLNINRF
jgi:hypothetical protein